MIMTKCAAPRAAIAPCSRAAGRSRTRRESPLTAAIQLAVASAPLVARASGRTRLPLKALRSTASQRSISKSQRTKSSGCEKSTAHPSRSDTPLLTRFLIGKQQRCHCNILARSCAWVACGKQRGRCQGRLQSCRGNNGVTHARRARFRRGCQFARGPRRCIWRKAAPCSGRRASVPGPGPRRFQQEVRTMSDPRPLGHSLAAGLEQLHRSWGWFLGLGVLLLILGIVCVLGEVATTLISVIVLGWLLLLSGVFALIHAFQTRTWSGFFLYLLSAVLRGFTG